MIRIVGAITLDRAIGVYPNKNEKGQLPWEQSEAQGDLSYFSQITGKSKSIVIMGRKTFESLDSKPLSGRHNMIISSKLSLDKSDGSILTFHDNLKKTIDLCSAIYPQNEKWNINLIGGTQIFAEGMHYADEIILTVVPIKAYERFDVDSLVYFPFISRDFYRSLVSQHPNNENLRIIKYHRNKK